MLNIDTGRRVYSRGINRLAFVFSLMLRVEMVCGTSRLLYGWPDTARSCRTLSEPGVCSQLAHWKILRSVNHAKKGVRLEHASEGNSELQAHRLVSFHVRFFLIDPSAPCAQTLGGLCYFDLAVIG